MKIKVKKKITESKKLNEASLEDEVKSAESQIDNDKVVNCKNSCQIETALDRALRTAERQKRTGGKNYTNIILIGGAGTGKTSAVRD
jgi:flagellar biosynthesis GTPase FlhF